MTGPKLAELNTYYMFYVMEDSVELERKLRSVLEILSKDLAADILTSSSKPRTFRLSLKVDYFEHSSNTWTKLKDE